MTRLPNGRKVDHFYLMKGARAKDYPQYFALIWARIEIADPEVEAGLREDLVKVKTPCKIMQIERVVLGLN